MASWARGDDGLTRGIAITNLISSSRGTRVNSVSDPQSLAILKSGSREDRFTGFKAIILLLPSNEFYRVLIGCVCGRFHVNAWLYPMDRTRLLKNMAFLLEHDKMGVDFQGAVSIEQHKDNSTHLELEQNAFDCTFWWQLGPKGTGFARGLIRMTVNQAPDSREVTLVHDDSREVALIHDRQSHMIKEMLDRSSYLHASGLSWGGRAPSWHMADNDDDNNGVGGDAGSDTGVVVRTKPKTKKPAMYKVIMLNDDYTPMEFVILVLERFFNKSSEEATQIMMHVHQKGVGVCGVFTYEVAETKVQQVMDLARQHQHPLQCTLEKA